ncbi:MAG: hypothetical protein CM15mP117_18620 [Alphaproteobacteria bacterium]|nr:MAG: hypothetical protein CM15mP117_18620 [Alphaproteobacteria bacterium]
MQLIAIDHNAQERNLKPIRQVPGIGIKRKRALLNHFGSARAVSNAGIQDLQAVPGISVNIAQHLYDWFHNREDN